MKCPKCDFVIADSNSFNFCPRCGSKLEEVAAATDDLMNMGIGEVTLPQMETIKQELGVAQASGKKRILIVEDDLFIRELYQKQLEIAGYAVEVAVDGLEGKDKMMNRDYELVLLDIMLPGMNGLDVLKEVKENPAKQNLSVIILSNLGQDSVVEKGLSLGAINYIVKADITPMEMLKVIEERIGA